MEREKIQEALNTLPALYSTDGLKQREVQIVIYHLFSRWTWYVVDGEFVDFDPEEEYEE